ncbi:hypothetical protein D3C78_1904270 [compost metagenome]
MSAVGPSFGMRTLSYHSRPFTFTPTMRVRAPRASGMPRKMRTLLAIAPIETFRAVAVPPSQTGRTVRKK